MADYMHRQTDKALKQLENDVWSIYAQSAKDLERKANKHFQRYYAADKEKRKLVESGEMSKSAYKKWKQRQLMTGRRWKAFQQQIAEDCTVTNQIAQSLINGRLPQAYADNANWEAFSLDTQAAGKGINTSWTVYNKNTVNRLIAEDPDILPFKEIDPTKDVAWNMRLLRRELTKSIIQGESIPDIAKRFMNIAKMNRSRALINARTAVNSAQNAGRYNSQKRAAEMGIEFEREWRATFDKRTRPSHRHADGQRVGVNEPFIVEGYKMMYPGDMSAPAHLVYNCRCTVVSRLAGYKGAAQRRTEERRESEAFKRWLDEKPVYKPIAGGKKNGKR